ncbi:MAG: PAS domain-containing protein [Epsilonproteobacteria bacterium]|nr:PAS domain-containing protein [Campylobacterota bacterium]
MSKTDLHGTIEYSNDYFIEVNGYQESELMGRTQNIIRHPDMPQIIFQMLWEHLQNHQNFSALIKNLAKDGRYYWVLAHFKIHNNQNNYEVGNYYAYRYAAPKTGVVEIEKLYKKLLEIEKQRGVEASKKYFVGFLEERAQSYEAYLNELTGHNRPIKRITKAIRNLFK